MILHSLLPTSAPGIPEVVEASASCPSLPSLLAETGLLLIHSLTLHALPTLLLSLLGSQSALSDGSFPKEVYGCGSRTLQLLPRPSAPHWGKLGHHLLSGALSPGARPSSLPPYLRCQVLRPASVSPSAHSLQHLTTFTSTSLP